MENYEKLEYINTGSFGKVCKIRRKSDNKILVWKELFYGNLSEKEKQQLVAEVNILRELRHPNIVRYYDRIIDKQNQKICIVMEYCEGGDINQLIKRMKKDKEYLPEETVWKTFMQVVLALHEIHRRKEGKILHRDIKPANMFLDSQNNIKLGDFGLSKILNEDSSFAYTNVGTPYYMSPEQINENKYSEKSDIWSAGCFLYELCALSPPFEASNHLSLALKIKNGKFERIPSKYSDEIQRVILWILSKNEDDRPSVDDLLNLPEISLRLREKRLKDNKVVLKKREEDLMKREEELIKQETNFKNKENDLKTQEKQLFELEKKLKQMEEKAKNTKAGRDRFTTHNNSIDDIISRDRNKINLSMKYTPTSMNNNIMAFGRANSFERLGKGTLDELDSNVPSNKLNRLSSGRIDETNTSEVYLNGEINNILKNMDRIRIDSNRGGDNSSGSGGNKSIENTGDTLSSFTNDLPKQNSMKIY